VTPSAGRAASGGSGVPPFDRSVTATAKVLPEIRQSVAHWVEPLELDEDDLGAVQVVVSELVANAVEASVDGEKVSVRLTAAPDAVSVEVANRSGRTRPVPIPPMAEPLAPRGRGLAIVRSLSHDLALVEVNGHTVASCRVPIQP
jgi:anti-sigma regulatory factor (Ser/Thr protein kinase)